MLINRANKNKQNKNNRIKQIGHLELSDNLIEGDGGGTLSGSHFSNLLSVSGHVFTFFVRSRPHF